MTTMDFSATLAALRRLRVETGSLVCFGCGHEHNCSTHGCAILRNAVEHMEAALSNYDSLSALVHRLETELKSEILSAAELRARLANEPLTLAELRDRYGASDPGTIFTPPQSYRACREYVRGESSATE